MCSAKHVHLHQWQTRKHQQKGTGRKIERKYTRNSQKNETLEAKMREKKAVEYEGRAQYRERERKNTRTF